MPKPAPRPIRLALVCLDPPPPEHEGRPAEFGLQDAAQVLHPGDALAGGALRFELEAGAVPRADGALDLRGRFVHGPAGGRFLYLGWRAIGGVSWIRRYKIPLAGLTWELLDAAGPAGLRASVRIAGRAATIPPAEPWASE